MRLLPALLSVTLTGLASGLVAHQPDGAREAPAIVFFAWDRPIIDGDAAARLDEIAKAIEPSPNARLALSGHADTSGPAASNIRSGKLRAEAVRDYLVARGVPGAAMTVVSHGETRPLIATADGVREPQNRRVEILVRRLPAS